MPVTTSAASAFARSAPRPPAAAAEWRTRQSEKAVPLCPAFDVAALGEGLGIAVNPCSAPGGQPAWPALQLPPRTSGGGSGLVGVELEQAGPDAVDWGRVEEASARPPAGPMRQHRRALPCSLPVGAQGRNPGAGGTPGAWRALLRLHSRLFSLMNSIAGRFGSVFRALRQIAQASSPQAASSSVSSRYASSDSGDPQGIEQAALLPGGCRLEGSSTLLGHGHAGRRLSRSPPLAAPLVDPDAAPRRMLMPSQEAKLPVMVA